MSNPKIDIRPVLNIKGDYKDEKFQNEVIRPIIKLQHSILIEIVKTHCKKYRINLKDLSLEGFNSQIEIIVKTNQTRNFLLGVIVGMFTVEEYVLYTQDATEYNKRIIAIIIQRLKDNKNQFI